MGNLGLLLTRKIIFSSYTKQTANAICINNGKEEKTGIGGANLRYLNLYRATYTPQPIGPEKQGTKVLLLDELVLRRADR
jgi:hypothetical protein